MALRQYIQALRRMMRASEELTADARRELLRTRLPAVTPEGKILAYSNGEWQQIMTALRHDVRTCRDRIREGRRLLAAFRSGGLEAGSQEEDLVLQPHLGVVASMFVVGAAGSGLASSAEA